MTIDMASTLWELSAVGGSGDYESDEPTGGSLPSDVYPLNIALTTPGRLGFYVDYSELSTTGTHTFYVCRTHGTVGAISVSYQSFGDSHTTVSGTLNWADGDASIQAVEVVVPSKVAGDHRMVLQLSSPTGGAVLHNGTNTIAHGVIDDDTIATSNAIFIDADAVSNGVGTEASPYNNWYDAREDVVVSTRYVYIKGMMVPDGTDHTAMSLPVKHLAIGATFSGRGSEADRLYVRGWPGFIGGVDGGGQTDTAGFACDSNDGGVTGSVDYITLRKLSGTTLDNTSGGSLEGKSYFLRTRGAVSETVTNWTTEGITVDGVISGANAATSVWFSEGSATEGSSSHYKMWKWDVSNTSHAFVSDNLNVYEGYRTESVSIQRCSIASTAGGFYEKEGTRTTSTVGLSMRFNNLVGSFTRISSQNGYAPQSYHIIQNNIFDTPLASFTSNPIQFDSVAFSPASLKHQISNNVFYNFNFTTSSTGAFKNVGFEDVILYNNIYLDVDQPWDFKPAATVPEYVDYDCYYSSGSLEFNVGGAQYLSVSALQAGTIYEDTPTETDPLFTDAAGGDFTLQGGSPCLSGGVDTTEQGVYLTGIEAIGA